MKIRLLLLLLLLPALLPAQNNYWSQQYGARSSLLGGSVVGGVRDNSALYYNPGCIGFIDHPTLSITANLYGLESINLANGAGNGLDFNSLKVLIYPQLVSGLVNFKKVPRLKMVYGLLTRYRTDVRMLAQNSMPYDVILNEPGDEFYYANINYELNSSSQWGGVGLGYKISDKVSVGFTQFVNYIHLDERMAVNTSADVTTPPIYTTEISESSLSIIDAVSLNWKLGLALDFGKFKMGISGTVPSVDLFGFARLSRNVEYFNQNRYIDTLFLVGRFPNLLITEDQRGLNARYRYPGSIAAGFEMNFPKTQTKLTFSAEYFFPIEKYTVAAYDSSVRVRPTGWFTGISAPKFLVKYSSAVQVINFAMGLEQAISPKMNFYFGIRTDLNNTRNFFTAAEPYNTSYINPTFWHNLHFSSGIAYRKGASDITLGLNYGLGITNATLQPFNITDPEVQLYAGFNGNTQITLQGDRQNIMTANVHSFSVILGYTYYIKR